jgi:hypothetical protein
MKKLGAILLTLALVGLVIPMTAIVSASPATMTVVSNTSVLITGVYNKAGGVNNFVDLSSSPLSAVRAWEPDPYSTTYPVEPSEATDSTWDNGVDWFEDNGSAADWIWETHLAEGPASYDTTDPLYDADAARYGRVVLFETNFNIPGNPISATLRIAADNGYEAWVNSGTHYRSATAAAGWETSNLTQSWLTTSGWQSYGTFSISGGELVNGSNTLYVLAGNEYFWSDDGNSPTPPTQGTWPDDYNQYNPGAAIFQLDVEYEEPELYDICGYKYAYWDDCYIALPGWNITVEKVVWNGTAEAWDPDPAFTPVTVTTNETGKYCFVDLEAGNYSVSEDLKDGWDQVLPDKEDGWVHIVELPGDDYDPEDEYNFVNTPEEWCGDQTAWAADPHPGDTRFENASNWATYGNYTRGDGNSTDPAVYPLYAGQHYLAGMLYVYDGDDTLYVQYTTEVPELILYHCLLNGGKVYQKEGYCAGEWTGLLEYHLAVGNTTDDIPRTVKGRGRNGSPTNPIPGQFEYSDDFDPAEPDTGWFVVDISELDDPFVIAAHAVMEWCGYDCRAMDEISAAVDLTGDWDLVIDYEGTNFPFTMTITDHETDGSLSGTLDALPLSGSCDYPLIAFDVVDGGLTVSFEGTVSCTSTMSGACVFSNEPENLYAWTATRVT